jgi:hypothetical protein
MPLAAAAKVIPGKPPSDRRGTMTRGHRRGKGTCGLAVWRLPNYQAHLQFCFGEVAAEQAEAQLVQCDKAARVDVVECGAQSGAAGKRRTSMCGPGSRRPRSIGQGKELEFRALTER